MRGIGTIAAALMVSSAGMVSAQQPTREIDWEKANPPLFAAMQADKAAPRPTAVIRYGTQALQQGELRVPKGRGPHPVAIVIHGGCWLARLGGTGMQAFSESLRRRGIATWDIDYRRVGHPGGGWPGTFQDVKAGVDHLPKLAERYNLDMDRVAVVGHSAGAHLALWTASRSKLGPDWAPGAGQPQLRAVVAIDGPAALAPFIGIDAQTCEEPVIVPLMGGTPAERPAEYRIATPADHLPLGMTQLIVLADVKPLMMPYVAAARASGDRVETLSPPKANHFDIVTPGIANGDLVADWIVHHAFSPSAKAR